MSSLRPAPAPPPAGSDPQALPPHPALPEFYSAPAGRVRFVTSLFDRTAGAYDRVSAWIAFGADRRYRRQALEAAGVRPGLRLLDVASGTGLVLAAALDLGLAKRDLVGLDPSRGMLDENRRQRPVALVQGFGERLPFTDGAFEFITMGYALRHVADLREFFGEIRRVLVPGGRVLILEITRPRSRLGGALVRFHLLKVVPWLARGSVDPREARRLLEYYWATIARCAPPEIILAALSAAGFRDVRRRISNRILSDYSAVKA